MKMQTGSREDTRWQRINAHRRIGDLLFVQKGKQMIKTDREKQMKGVTKQ